ncbi:SIR2 family protein [uncultured Marivita sp.]|uniref:SIR2 family protein n=1 Tax=uncultured Marivita sp. TaxID=888080 RepID=UPI00262F5B9D|nr:SIR2 family protein [uncultured Marivita sp.]
MTVLSPYKLLSPVSAGESDDLLKDKSPDEGIRRIQALLADWLRMENVVVLTAAGCSVGCGGRLMAGRKANNLECLVLEAVAQTPVPDSAKAVIRHRISGWPAGDDGPLGFEDWLSYLFNVSGLTASDQSPIQNIEWKGTDVAGADEHLSIAEDDLAELQTRIEKAIFAECALQIDRSELSGADAESSSGHIPFLAKLSARDTNLGRTHLFTLNYDTLFEQAMEELGIQYFDGFSGKTSSRFDPAVYGLDIYYPGDVAEGRVRRFDKFMQFYKLHGSLHWYVDEAGIYRARHRDLSFAAAYREASAQDKALALESEAFSGIESFGILPTSQKFTQTLGMPYAHLFRLFHARLNQPQTFLLVMGYGFGDEHVTRIIETALMNPSLVMLVVEPNPDSEIVKRIRRYQSLGQRAFVLTERLVEGQGCSYKTATFADFARNVMPDVKWLDDYKRLRMFEEQIKKTDDREPQGGAGDD